MPPSNSPVTNVALADMACNVGGQKGVSGKCAIEAGGNVTVEMHQVRHELGSPRSTKLADTWADSRLVITTATQ